MYHDNIDLQPSRIHFNFSLEQVILYDLTCSLVFKWLEFSSLNTHLQMPK